MRPSLWRLLERDLFARQDLAPSTVKKTLGNLHTLEDAGVDLVRPARGDYDTFVAKRKKRGARGTELIHYHQAMQRLLRARRIKWDDFDAPNVVTAPIVLPPDEVVRRQLDYGAAREAQLVELLARRIDDDVDDQDDVAAAVAIPANVASTNSASHDSGQRESGQRVSGQRVDVDEDLQELEPELRDLRALRFAFRFGYYTGARPPSEHVAVRVDDFDRDSGELQLWASKVDKRRTIILEPWLRQIVADYIDGPRAAIDNGTSDALQLNPETGGAWPPDGDAYRMWLTRAGKGILRSWKPYAARHWAITYRIVQTGFDLLAVQAWAGHAKIATTEKYIHVAQDVLRRRMLEHAVQPFHGDAAASTT